MKAKVEMGKANIILDLQNRVYMHNTYSPEGTLLKIQEFPLLDEWATK